MGEQLKIGGWYYGFFLIILAFNFENKKKFYVILLVAVITALLIGERANLIKFIIASCIFIFITKKITVKSVSISLILFLITFFIIFQSSTLKSRFYAMFIEKLVINKTFKDFHNDNHYTPLYLNALDIFKNNKIFGTGVGNYWEVSNENYRNKKKINDYDIFGNTHPHQYHFEILATLGLSGYIYLAIFFIYAFIKNFKIYLKTKNKLNIGCLVMLFVSLIPLIPSGSFFTTYGASIFWLNFALMNLGNINRIKDH